MYYRGEKKRNCWRKWCLVCFRKLHFFWNIRPVAPHLVRDRWTRPRCFRRRSPRRNGGTLWAYVDRRESGRTSARCDSSLFFLFFLNIWWHGVPLTHRQGWTRAPCRWKSSNGFCVFRASGETSAFSPSLSRCDGGLANTFSVPCPTWLRRADGRQCVTVSGKGVTSPSLRAPFFSYVSLHCARKNTFDSCKVHLHHHVFCICVESNASLSELPRRQTLSCWERTTVKTPAKL